MAAKIELETGGTVWKLEVAEGDKVSAGQTLFNTGQLLSSPAVPAAARGGLEEMGAGDTLVDDLLSLLAEAGFDIEDLVNLPR